jgi:hypothetical protein
VKLFIPTFKCTVGGFQSFFSGQIKPKADQSNYADFKFMNEAITDSITQFYGQKEFTRYSRPSLSSGKQGANVILFLPVPSYLLEPFNALLEKDQNLQLVNKPEEADYVLYLDYFKPRDKNPGGFAFYFHPRIDDPANSQLSLFSLDHFETSSLMLSEKELQTASSKLYRLAVKTIRYKTTAWINPDPRR